ncbi:MAG: hypothetical protein PHE55_23385, partial [Methylococcaceae bacterium]|nr:hypothetical protein [Methylococcaceae bacterium]
MAEIAYLPVSISGKRFKSLAHSKWVDGFAVETILIVNEAWQKEHLPAFDNILLALQGVRSSMEGHK